MGIIEKLPPPPQGRVGWPWTEETTPSIYQNNATWPRITIITPSFNQGRYIEETIRSVLLQNYPNLEYLVIDGGSTDETLTILHKYSQWIDYWVSEHDSGQSNAINKGLSRVKDGWFNWINSDDLLLNACLHEIGQLAICSPESRFIVGQLELLTCDGDVSLAEDFKPNRPLSEIIVSHRVCQPAMYYRVDASGARVNEHLHMAMDYEYMVRHFLQYGLSGSQWTKRCLARFRLHNQAKTSIASELFEKEERMVIRAIMRGLAEANGNLNLICQDNLPVDYEIRVEVTLAEIRKAVSRRFLLGDLRKAIYNKSDARKQLFLYCVKCNFLTTIVVATKAMIKRILGIPLR